ncbi:hypothetical protein BS47DRAFT_1362347 [Hydnum rufescens UP504]|uniref:Uncharacterized protein n=1 Tax=Hydnum rufescens UP504 TaxID=1448309 RepID=A0A9P6DTW0_9AGAM|nr:hypothetical protein BS47DRAFT_1362347 [Hydnum rufescens UP504]
MKVEAGWGCGAGQYDDVEGIGDPLYGSCTHDHEDHTYGTEGIEFKSDFEGNGDEMGSMGKSRDQNKAESEIEIESKSDIAGSGSDIVGSRCDIEGSGCDIMGSGCDIVENGCKDKNGCEDESGSEDENGSEDKNGSEDENGNEKSEKSESEGDRLT